MDAKFEDRLDTLRELAAQKRVDAKRILGEVVGRSGYLNPDLPMSRFVDTLMGAILVETTILIEQALFNRNSKDEPEPTDKPDL
jgi:hypothetical protein